MAVDMGTLIERSPELRHNRPRIAGTGVSVRTVVGWYQLGMSPDEIAGEMPHLSFAQVYAALAYYFANRQEIDQDIAAEAAHVTDIERRHVRRRA